MPQQNRTGVLTWVRRTYVEDYFAGLLQLAEASTSPLAQDRKAEIKGITKSNIQKSFLEKSLFISYLQKY
jgi:hypothetical protein